MMLVATLASVVPGVARRAGSIGGGVEDRNETETEVQVHGSAQAAISGNRLFER